MRRSPEADPAAAASTRSARAGSTGPTRAASTDPNGSTGSTRRLVQKPLVIGCGALARELVALTRSAGVPEVDLACLPATLHNRPERIPDAVRARIRKARAAGREQLFVAYADCGTGGMLDRVLEDEGVARLEGAHCYEIYAGRAAFAAISEEEPGTFYLTDFLARNFERLVVRGLGLDRHPELLPMYFGNYTRVVYLAQTEDPVLDGMARRGARRLGLRFERRFTGHGELGPAVSGFRVDAGPVPGHGAAHSRDGSATAVAPDARTGALLPRDTAAVAPDARTETLGAGRAAAPVVSVRSTHTHGALRVGAPNSLRPAHRSDAPARAARSLLRPAQSRAAKSRGTTPRSVTNRSVTRQPRTVPATGGLS